MTLDELETNLRRRAGEFAGLNALVKFEFGHDGALYVDTTQSPPTVGRDGADPRTTIRMSLTDFGRMVDGQLSPMWAFTTGKLKVDGDTGLAMKLSGILDG